MATAGTKSENAYRTISEVAEELGVAPHVLRFWETKFPQLRPLKRSGGRRYYRPEDVALLREIKTLLHEEGYTIRGARRCLRERRARAAGAGPPREGREAAEMRALAARLRRVAAELRTLLDSSRG